jgi:hypothetical protein
MLSEPEFKRRLGSILSIEEHGEDADWFIIKTMSAELLEKLPASAPPIVRAYLTDSDLRRVSCDFADEQLSELIKYLRSSGFPRA